ncbi:MAG TPA: ribonuclease PH [Candidatus Lokiarchaeia archaeon]|nr:ribonuclease PH [Candidatus Lokiarchaeia archaeon]
MALDLDGSRFDGRSFDEMRPVKITRNYLIHPEGSVLIEQGNTKVIVTATIEENVPPFLKDSGNGWVTAEYAMLPRATITRNRRETMGAKGRTQEIQRLVGRALREAVDMTKLGERTITIDCDVIQADGGTRCASITGGMVALYDGLNTLVAQGMLAELPIKNFIAAISVGIYRGQLLVDLNYIEDSKIDVDFNVIQNDQGGFVEVQGTGERGTFSQDLLNQLLDAAQKANTELIALQRTTLGLE